MWYITMILEMYMAIPFLSIIVYKFSLKAINIPIIIWFTCSTLILSVSVYVY